MDFTSAINQMGSWRNLSMTPKRELVRSGPCNHSELFFGGVVDLMVWYIPNLAWWLRQFILWDLFGIVVFEDVVEECNILLLVLFIPFQFYFWALKPLFSHLVVVWHADIGSSKR